MRFRFQSPIVLISLGLTIVVVILIYVINISSHHVKLKPKEEVHSGGNEWRPPDSMQLLAMPNTNLVLYGRDLIVHTSHYLGPKGVIAHLTNGMECQNCHLDAGTRNFGNPFSAVMATYPRYSPRSNKNETLESRINDCMQRSLNGMTLDDSSSEMKAMCAYIKWVGKEVPKGLKPKGAGTEMPPFLNRAADEKHGKIIYINNCQRCHGANGEGLIKNDSSGYVYPPLWNIHSYNISAGMYTLSKLAGFIKNNMPYGTNWHAPFLTNEEAWDVAAFINLQNRPIKKFDNDWPDVSKKTFDYPFGPYADTFSEIQHKLGPFGPIVKRH